MKVNFSQTFPDFDGEPIKDDDPKSKTHGQVLTLGLIGTRALMGVTEDTHKEPGEQKVKDHDLARRIYKGGDVDIKPEEAVRLKGRIAIFFGPIVSGQALPMLDGPDQPKE